jgi:hypothetical protein
VSHSEEKEQKKKRVEKSVVILKKDLCNANQFVCFDWLTIM